ncbi:uncharacterized protein AMSG_10782 [Thecamonas trahens ATCC 50062]|uniref:C2 domain-containing protein n=1 Tax=Thecamonas trahens ATCC 50062 TaxID=461836 RepID=A0A0L0DSC4_THETB|nr:hypothetical protein AMSG_10782 [Thecamonas trahens ATCC 50062]KNC55170.1 hypothetical protein AMSG_10782 [Thecamonas trahens ATCC 50062]|eukprot:XP_013753223.1 hypothetical protein AMSG_10782 [Thecamonas trahens ATCC 50062]
MHRAEPSANRILTKRWNARNHAQHKKRLRSVRSRVDNGPPRQYLHLHLNLKKLQQEEERMSQIEKDNRILLGKMSAIMRQKNTLDNRNARYKRGKPSLNRLKRKKELARITRENQRILSRIQSIQPTYNHVAWEQDRLRQQRMLANICEYPYLPPDAAAEPSLTRAQLEEMEARRRAEEDEKVRMQLLKRPKKAPTYHQPRNAAHYDDRPYSPDADDSYGYPEESAGLAEVEPVAPSRPTASEPVSPAGAASSAASSAIPAGSVAPVKVRVCVVEAADLASHDIDSANPGQTSDPYVAVKVGKTKRKTQTVQNSERPVFNEVFEFDELVGDEAIELKVMDDDTFSDDTIGVASFAVAAFDLNVEHDIWVNVTSDGATTGQLRLKLMFVAPGDEAGEGKGEGEGEGESDSRSQALRFAETRRVLLPSEGDLDLDLDLDLDRNLVCDGEVERDLERERSEELSVEIK